MAGYKREVRPGVWRLEYQVDNEKYSKNVKAKNDREANKILTLFIAEIEKGNYRKDSGMTFTELAQLFLDKYATIIYCTLVILAFLFVLYVMNKRDEATYKVLWILVITTLPILGTILYLFFGNQKTSRGLKKALTSSKGKINY